MTLLSEDELLARISELSGWSVNGPMIEREWQLADFAAAIDFVARVAAIAERLNHHPDILVHGYNRVRLTLSTHSEGGVTEYDLQLARELQGL